MCDLLGAYDHMIDVHELCKNNQLNHDQSEEKLSNFKRVKEYISNTVGYCTILDCSVLKNHRMRKRERELRNVDSAKNGDNSLKEILTATLNALHCYTLHKKKHIFRLERSDKNIHFITPQDDKQDEKLEEQSGSALNIKFGVSVLEWLDYPEISQFPSLRTEIVNNPNSTINEELFLNFAQESFIKMINRKEAQFTLKELMSLKLYTDTDKYQSALRKAFWKTSSKKVKNSFYQWASQLYKTSLFHAKPTPRWKVQSKKPLSIFHGLNMVFVVEDALPMYNGPISTSLDETIAHNFSKGQG
eukprot:383940_1